MRARHFFISTLKEAPADAEIISHQLMLRAGLIRRLAGGIYTWMPLGLRVLRKVESIVREEMNRAGAVELLMPAVQPAELWQESGRWEEYGPELLRFKDRHQRDFVVGPTHEEVITDIVRREIKSYRQLPRHFYQIQNKFRDEIRPRFGVMRGREFLMKDGYSFYAANVELAEALAPAQGRAPASEPMREVATPGKIKCSDVSALLGIGVEKMVKAIAIMREEAVAPFALILLRGDHDLNEVKAQKIVGHFRFARDEEVIEHLGCRPGYIGPVATTVTTFVDRSVVCLSDFVCGANKAGFHLAGVNFGRDLAEPQQVFDLRNVITGDPSPDGRGKLELCRGIEVGHIFQLRTKYSEALNCSFLNDTGQPQVMEMGCYGIGVSRIVGAAIEQGNDARGIVFPAAISPFEVVIVPVGYGKSEAVREEAGRIYETLLAAGCDVILDDRDERPGVMFADWELIGVPHRVVVGERGLKQGLVEYQGRRDAAATNVALAELVGLVRQKLQQ